jgi:hypothetical protein
MTSLCGFIRIFHAFLKEYYDIKLPIRPETGHGGGIFFRLK